MLFVSVSNYASFLSANPAISSCLKDRTQHANGTISDAVDGDVSRSLRLSFVPSTPKS